MNDDNNNGATAISDRPHDMIAAALARAISSAPDTILRGNEPMSASSDFPKTPGAFGRSTW
ncbi:MAG TPA: hypothetical protein VLM79_03665 [Kofleriaceae bacterium]|nr:hypothetical protein [Kofleriaceae bacterium]